MPDCAVFTHGSFITTTVCVLVLVAGVDGVAPVVSSEPHAARASAAVAVARKRAYGTAQTSKILHLMEACTGVVAAIA
jgi:hypothetical protein